MMKSRVNLKKYVVFDNGYEQSKIRGFYYLHTSFGK